VNVVREVRDSIANRLFNSGSQRHGNVYRGPIGVLGRRCITGRAIESYKIRIRQYLKRETL
jgi:hypothetical protein